MTMILTGDIVLPAAMLLAGLGAGLLSALLGVGGAVLYVPVLQTLAHATPIQITSTSLLAIAFSATSGTIQNWRMRQLNIRQVALIAPIAMLSAELATHGATQLSPEFLSLGFMLFCVGVIHLMNLRQQLLQRQQNRPGQVTSKATFLQAQTIGILAGGLSGLLGVGSGAILVPLQMLFLNESVKSAVRTSLGIITVIAITVVVRQSSSGNVLWIPGLCLGLGGLCGAQWGARLLPKLPDAWVIYLFRLLVLLVAGYTLWQIRGSTVFWVGLILLTGSEAIMVGMRFRKREQNPVMSSRVDSTPSTAHNRPDRSLRAATRDESIQ